MYITVLYIVSLHFGQCPFCYNPGQNLLRQIAKMPIFSCHPGKNWNLRQMNARFPPSPYPKLFRIAWQLYTLVFNRGWGGGLLFVFRGDGRRAQKLENRWNCLNSFVRGCLWRPVLQIAVTSQCKVGGYWFFAQMLYLAKALWLLKKVS